MKSCNTFITKTLVIIVFALLGGNSTIWGQDYIRPLKVVGQKYFKKLDRLEFFLGVGSSLNETYIDTRSVDLSVSYSWSEFMGVSIKYGLMRSWDNNEKIALEKITYPSELEPNNPEKRKQIRPEINYIKQSTDVSFIYTPLYGKIAVLNKSILYLDLFLPAGISYVETSQGYKPAVHYGIGQHFFLNKNISLRVNFLNYNFFEEKGAQRDSYLRNHFQFVMGISYYL